MDYLFYQKKINDVIIKCPIEAGIEILVYNLLDECICIDEYALVDINRIWKNQYSRLLTEAGISDIAILSPNFVFTNVLNLAFSSSLLLSRNSFIGIDG